MGDRFPWKCLVQTGHDDRKTIGGVSLGFISWHHRDCPIFTDVGYCDCYESTLIETLSEQNHKIKRIA